MTNKELAVRIQQGERELIPQLWEQVVRFITAQAHDYISLRIQNGQRCDGELGDFVDQAFFGFLSAIRLFDPDAGNFLTILKLAIKTSFSEVAGCRRATQRSDCANVAVSGDAKVTSADFCLFDTVQDDRADPAMQVVEALYLEQLRTALDRAMQQLPDGQADILRARYYGGLTQKKIAGEFGCTSSNVGRMERAALSTLYADRAQNGLDQFLEEHTNWDLHVGVKRFKSTHTSSVEEIVFQREELVSRWIKEHCGGGEHK